MNSDRFRRGLVLMIRSSDLDGRCNWRLPAILRKVGIRKEKKHVLTPWWCRNTYSKRNKSAHTFCNRRTHIPESILQSHRREESLFFDIRIVYHKNSPAYLQTVMINQVFARFSTNTKQDTSSFQQEIKNGYKNIHPQMTMINTLLKALDDCISTLNRSEKTYRYASA